MARIAPSVVFGGSSFDTELLVILVYILFWLCAGCFLRGVFDIYGAVAPRNRNLTKGLSKRRQANVLHGTSNSHPPSSVCVGAPMLFLHVVLLGACCAVGDGARLVAVLFKQLASTYVSEGCHYTASPPSSVDQPSSRQPRHQSRRQLPCWALHRGFLLVFVSLNNFCWALPLIPDNVSSNTSVVGMRLHLVGIMFMFALPIVYLIGGCACKDKPKTQTPTYQPVVSPRVQNAINKIKAQQTEIAAEYYHVKQHATLSAESLKVLERQTKDAIGVLRCEIDSTTTARDTKLNMLEEQGYDVESRYDSRSYDRIKYLRKTLGNVLELFTAWDLQSAVTHYSKHKLKALPLASTQPGTTATNLTVQRVIGELTVAEARGKDVAAYMKMALEVYNEGRNAAAAAITNAIMNDEQQYTKCMRPHWSSPSEVAALNDLATVPARMTKQLFANGMPFKDADTLTFDPAAPNGTTPARAIYNRHVAASASIALYAMLCKISSTLECTVEVIPGGVKALARMVYKSVLNYRADFSKCRDATRATMEVNSIQDVVMVVNALLVSQDIVILRTKDRFQQSYDSRPIGGYRDFQALCIFKHNRGWVYGEVQINLAELVKIKGRKGGGHAVFKYARSIAAYTESTYTWTGAASIEMCERIENGMLINVNLDEDKTLGKDFKLFERFLKALSSPQCRVASVT